MKTTSFTTENYTRIASKVLESTIGNNRSFRRRDIMKRRLRALVDAQDTTTLKDNVHTQDTTSLDIEDMRYISTSRPASPIPSIFSTQSGASSNTNVSETTIWVAIEQFAKWLAQDDDVRQSFIRGKDNPNITPESLVNSFRRLLKLYGAQLFGEAKSQKERQAASFVRERARYTVLLVIDAIEPGSDKQDHRLLALNLSDIEKASRLTTLLQDATQQAMRDDETSRDYDEILRDHDETSRYYYENIDLSEDDGESGQYSPSDIDFPELAEMRSFLFNGQAFVDFKNSLRRFVEKEATGDHQKPRAESTGQSTTAVAQWFTKDTIVAFILDGFIRLLEVVDYIERPVKPGRWRGRWTCVSSRL